MELINKMYLTYANTICRYYNIDLYDLYQNDQGRSIARSIPDISKKLEKIQYKKKFYSDFSVPNSVENKLAEGSTQERVEEQNPDASTPLRKNLQQDEEDDDYS